MSLTPTGPLPYQCQTNINRPVGKVNDSYVESLFSKDSCDGSGLNISENSKDSHPKGFNPKSPGLLFSLNTTGGGGPPRPPPIVYTIAHHKTI